MLIAYYIILKQSLVLKRLQVNNKLCIMDMSKTKYFYEKYALSFEETAEYNVFLRRCVSVYLFCNTIIVGSSAFFIVMTTASTQYKLLFFGLVLVNVSLISIMVYMSGQLPFNQRVMAKEFTLLHHRTITGRTLQVRQLLKVS